MTPDNMLAFIVLCAFAAFVGIALLVFTPDQRQKKRRLSREDGACLSGSSDSTCFDAASHGSHSDCGSHSASDGGFCGH